MNAIENGNKLIPVPDLAKEIDKRKRISNELKELNENLKNFKRQ